MNNQLISALARTGISGIHRTVDSAVIELISEFDSSPDKYSLASTVLGIYGADHFLRHKNNRNILMEHLEEEMAFKLCKDLNLDENINSGPWECLAKNKFGKKQQEILLNFFGVLVEDNKCEEETSLVKPSLEETPGRYSLFSHQNRAAYEVKQIIRSKVGRVLLHMPTGSGKTRTTMSIICDILRENSGSNQKQLILWLADTEELCDQAADEFIKAWASLGSEKIGMYRFYGDHEQDLISIKEGVVVAGVAKINSRLNKSQTEIFGFGSNVNLVVFDEAHKVVAPTYENLVGIIQQTGSAKLIGLSATPGRATLDEEKNEKFAEFFDKKRVELKVDGHETPTDFLQHEGYLAKIENHKLPYHSKDLVLTHSETNHILSGGEIPTKLLKQLGDDTKRNIIIVNTILERVGLGDFIIVFACSVSHAKAIAALLRFKHIKAGLVTGETPATDRRETIDSYKKREINVIINYGVLTTGFDAPNTNVALIARPTTSLMLYSQMVGRAIRGTLAGGNEVAHIYTVVDSEIPGFENLSEAFNHWNESWN